MDVALLCPLSVGLVSWPSPDPRRTVIVKATFALDRDGELQLSAEQRPLDLDRPGVSSPDELEAASDFAPHKERVDVLLVGHAHASAPTCVMAAAIRVGELHHELAAVSAAPATRIPLSIAYVRTDVSPSGVPQSVGPLSPTSGVRRPLAGDQVFDGHGIVVGTLATSFHFGFFNAAPPRQQIDALPPGAEIAIWGLLPGAPRRKVVVPRRRPLVYLVNASGEREGVGVGLRCDTLTIDTDRAELSLVWRGTFDGRSARGHTCLLVGFELLETRWGATELWGRLGQARHGRAIEPSDVRSPAPSARTHTEEITAPVAVRSARTASLPFRPSESAAGAPASGRAPEEAASLARLRLMDATLSPSPQASAPGPLPFRAAGEPARAASEGAADVSEMDSTIMPPQHAWRPATLPFRATDAARGRPDREEVTSSFLVRKVSPTLPFQGAGQARAAPRAFDDDVTTTAFRVPEGGFRKALSLEPAPPAIVREPDVAEATLPPTPYMPHVPFAPLEPSMPHVPFAPLEPSMPHVPFAPSMPSPTAPHAPYMPSSPISSARPAPQAPGPELLSVERYASICVELSQGNRREVLARHGFKSAAWKLQERMQIEAIEAEALAGRTSRATALEEALEAAAACG